MARVLPCECCGFPNRIRYDPESKYEMEQVVMRMLDELEDVPGFLSLKFFFDSIGKTADIIEELYCGSNPDLPRECSGTRVFVKFLSHMTREEKARHLVPLFDMFMYLIPRHQIIMLENSYNCSWYKDANRCAWSLVDLVPLCVKWFRKTAKNTSGELVRLVANMLFAIHECLERLFQCMDPNDEHCMDPNDVDYLLTCFSDERFQPDGIMETDFLMVILSLFKGEMLSAVLIRHGFKYSFHHKYYQDCCVKLRDAGNTGTVKYGLRMNNSWNSGNLGMQMAVEILVHLLCGEYGMNRELFCMLWMSRSDPFITPHELYHLMEPYFVPSSVLVDACLKYRDLFPWVPEVKQPRSLKHLARVRIREIMVRAHSIGEKAVRSLGLPKTLEDYLWKLETF